MCFVQVNQAMKRPPVFMQFGLLPRLCGISVPLEYPLRALSYKGKTADGQVICSNYLQRALEDSRNTATLAKHGDRLDQYLFSWQRV